MTNEAECRLLLGMRLDLNCDLGEGESWARTRALMRQATSVSVACGGHAGNATTMEQCVRLGKELRVRVGAHPGLSGNFGRAETAISATELELLLLQQVGALNRLTEIHGIRLHHVKLHGALYHAVEREPPLGEAYVAAVGRWFRGLPIYALAGGKIAALGRKRGIIIWEEAFLDRNYDPRGSLVSRSEPHTLLTEFAQIRRRVYELRAGQGLEAHDGTRLALRPRTLCVHGDSPQALQILRLARAALAGRIVRAKLS